VNFENLNAQLEPICRAHPDAIKSIVETTTCLIIDAMDKQTGICSHDTLFSEVRPLMPSSADIGMNADLTDDLLRMLIEETVDYRSRPTMSTEQELAMLNQIIETMERHGFKTVGEAIAFLRQKQAN